MQKPLSSRVWVVGHLTIDDLVFRGGSTAMATVGGAALYAALGAWVVGAPSRIVSRLGSGFPTGVLDRLASWGIENSLEVVAGPSINQWAVYEADGSKTYLLHPGSGSLEDLSPSPSQHVIPVSATVHLAPMPLVEQSAWCTGLAAHQQRLTLDPHPDSCVGDRSTMLRMVSLVHAFLPSEQEARLLTGGDPVEAVRVFRAAGAPIAGVKVGSEGSIIGVDDEIWHIPALPVAVRDVTGAGDAFCGAFAAALAWGCDAVAAGCWATAAASFIVETVGVAVLSAACTFEDVAARVAAVTPVRLVASSR